MFAVVTAGSLLLSGTLAGGTANAAAGPVITTIAGGDGGPGPGTSVAVLPCAVASDGGPVYVSDGSVLRELSEESTDQLAPVAGVSELGNVPGSLSSGASGLSAWVKQGCGIAADSNQNLLYADASTFQVRVLAEHTGSYYGQNMTAGHVYTIAGTGVSGFGGDGGPALKAELADPTGVTTDAAGNVIISDAKVARIRVVAERTGAFYGKAMTAGDIYTVVTLGGGSDPTQTAVDHAGNLVIAEQGSGPGRQVVLQVFAATSGTFYGRAMHVGGRYTIATVISSGNPTNTASVTVDAEGNVVFSDEDGYLVRVVAGSTGSFYGQSMKVGGRYTVAGNGQGNYNGDGIPATTAGMQPVGVAVDSAGNLVIADANNRLRVVAVSGGTYYGQQMTAGDIYTVAGNGTADLSGSGGPATAAELGGTFPSVSDSAGNVLFCDNAYETYECHVLAAKTGLFYGLQMTAGDLYTIAGVSASSVALDAFGNVLFDAGEVLAAKTGFYYSKYMIAGHLYSVPALAGGTLALDHYGNVTESGMGQYTGVVNIFAAKTGTFYGQSMTALHVYHVAGTLTPSGSTANGVKAVNAYIGDPVITIGDSRGNLVIDDGGYGKVRVVAATSGTFYGQAMKAGDIYTIAGVQKGGSTANGIPAVQASIGPSDVAFDAAGNLVISDGVQSKVRVVATRTGTFYGQAMKAGDIYTIAGNGTSAFGGDGGSPLSASLYQPNGVTVLPDGNIIVSDSDRIRLITVS